MFALALGESTQNKTWKDWLRTKIWGKRRENTVPELDFNHRVAYSENQWIFGQFLSNKFSENQCGEMNGYNSKLSDFPHHFAGHGIWYLRPSLRSFRNLSWVKKEINVLAGLFLLYRFERNFTVILVLGNLQCFSILAANFMPHFMPNLLSSYNDDEIAFWSIHLIIDEHQSL